MYLLVCWLLALYAFYAYVLLRIAFFAASPFAGPLLILLISLVSYIAYSLVIRALSKNLKDIIAERCDPEEYLRIYRFIIHSSAGEKTASFLILSGL